MIIDFTTVLRDIKGDPIKDGPDSALTLGSVVTTALLAAYEDERGLSGDDKVRRFLLANTIYQARGALDVQVEDVALIKKLVAKAFSTMIVGQAWGLLDPKPKSVGSMSA